MSWSNYIICKSWKWQKYSLLAGNCLNISFWRSGGPCPINILNKMESIISWDRKHFQLQNDISKCLDTKKFNYWNFTVFLYILFGETIFSTKAMINLSISNYFIIITIKRRHDETKLGLFNATIHSKNVMLAAVKALSSLTRSNTTSCWFRRYGRISICDW